MELGTFVVTLALLAIQAIAIAILAFNFRGRHWPVIRIVAAFLSILIAVIVGTVDHHEKRVHHREARILHAELDGLRSQLATADAHIKSMASQVKDLPNLPSQVRIMVERDLFPDAPRSLQPASERIRIESPKDGSRVSNMITVGGVVDDPRMSVWVLVHPNVRRIREFWVQHRASVTSTGHWQALAYVGRPGDIDRGVPYEVMAVADPEVPVQFGQVLDWWPRAACRSQIVNIVRE